jgi:hypothetical protein
VTDGSANLRRKTGVTPARRSPAPTAQPPAAGTGGIRANASTPAASRGQPFSRSAWSGPPRARGAALRHRDASWPPGHVLRLITPAEYSRGGTATTAGSPGGAAPARSLSRTPEPAAHRNHLFSFFLLPPPQTGGASAHWTSRTPARYRRRVNAWRPCANREAETWGQPGLSLRSLQTVLRGLEPPPVRGDVQVVQ